MGSELVGVSARGVTGKGQPTIPAIIADAGDHAARRFLEFFTATIRNPNTRRAYAKAVGSFLAWCEEHGLTLRTIEPLHVAAYIEQLTAARSAPTVKQHLAAIRMLFDWLTSGRRPRPSTRPAPSAAPGTSSNAARRPCSRPRKPASSSTASTPLR